MKGSFAGKVILITGATSGIGREVAIQLAGDKVQLILAARRVAELEVVEVLCREKGAECLSLYLDLSLPHVISQFVDTVAGKFKVIDILINNGGISQRSLAEETPIENDRKIMETNFFGQVALTKSLWPLLTVSNHANIVNISSVTGTFGFPQRSAYSASKHALEGFFESWMLENKRSNIYFTTVSPGRIFTNISYSALLADGTTHQKLDNGQANGIPVSSCATKIIKGILKDKRKVYVVQNEIVLVILRKCFPFLFFRIAKNIAPN